MAKQDAARLKEIDDIQEAIQKAVARIDESLLKKKPQTTKEGMPA